MRNENQRAIYGARANATLTSGWSRPIGLLLVVLAAATLSPAQDEQASLSVVTFNTLANFDGTNGGNPFSTLVQGIDGNFYGTTAFGGANNSGTVFKVTPSGTVTTLHNFCSQTGCTDGANPGQLVQATDGDFYGTAGGGIFKITPSGTLTTLYTFCALPNCADGADPNGLVQATDGNLYGTTNGGGNNNNAGVVFKITRDGALTTLYDFCSQPNCTDGSFPAAPMIQATDGNLYGTTQSGGTMGSGTVFKITLDGALTILHNFDFADGGLLQSPVVQATNGKLYGTSTSGGANCGNFSCAGGTVFEVTPAGAFTLLYSFCAQTGCTDGSGGQAGLIQATDGNLYGATAQGGTHSGCSLVPSCGTLFKITPGGTLTTLHNFDGTDGSYPAVSLIQGTNGTLYGVATADATSNSACAAGCGTVFALSVGLGPFVETLPTIGEVGEAVRILGTDLTGATSVRFNGKAAEFNVVSPTEIVTRVPDDAKTGFVTVMTPSGTLKSNMKFHVRED